MANLDEFVPPAFEIPAMIEVVYRVFQSVPVKYIEEYIVVELIDGRGWLEAS
jgi:hypothetical protein